MPGFGCPRPAEFGATKDEYVEWLVAELEGMDGPVDLVGHDWGAGLTYRVATAHGRPAPIVDRRRGEPDAPGLRVARLRPDLADAREG